MKLVSIILIVLVIVVHAGALKILGIFPHNGKSHFFVFRRLLLALAEKGHEITIISYFPEKNPPRGYREIILDKPLYPVTEAVDVAAFGVPRLNKYKEILELAHEGRYACEYGLSAEPVQQLIKSKDEKFDIIITEYFDTPCFLGFAYMYSVPVVAMSSCTLIDYYNPMFGNPDNPAYIPNNLLFYSDEIPFLGRVEQTLYGILDKVAYKLLIEVPSTKIARTHFGNDMPDLWKIEHNTSLILVNAHFSLTLPRPLVPTVVDVGGLHIGKVQKLPQNIEKWINESTHGVIYFSLGSMIKGHTFPEEKRQAFLRAFGRLPQRVLWKWENDTMPGQPDNVMIQKWMPQLDILCHPNVKAFISHGGLLGTTEAVHCGVPVVVMPQFGDQHTNAKALEKNGGGVILHLHEADEEKVYNALKKVLDPSFNKQAKELSERFRDRPMPPLETAIYWVEYVARHKGAPHMRTAAVGMPLYKYLLLDVIAFLIAVFTVLSWLGYYITKKAIKLVFRSKEKVKTS